MNHRLVLFALLLGLMLVLAANAQPLLQSGDRLAICGDALADSTGYSIYIEDYLLVSQPIAGLDFAQFHWSAGDPSGFLRRLDTDLLPYKPTVVLTHFNFGDVKTRRKAQTDLVNRLKKAGVRTIVIGSPECVDSVNWRHDSAAAAAENRRLAALAAIDKDVRGKGRRDLCRCLRGDHCRDAQGKVAPRRQVRGPRRCARFGCRFRLSRKLGCDGRVATITVDFAAQKAKGTPGQRIVSFRDTTLEIESSRIAFWFPGHGVGAADPPPWPNLAYMPFNAKLNRYILIVKNLPTAQTKIYWGDLNRDFSSEQLAKGINLAAEMPAWNPFGGLTSDVRQRRARAATTGADRRFRLGTGEARPASRCETGNRAAGCEGPLQAAAHHDRHPAVDRRGTAAGRSRSGYPGHRLGRRCRRRGGPRAVECLHESGRSNLARLRSQYVQCAIVVLRDDPGGE